MWAVASILYETQLDVAEHGGGSFDFSRFGARILPAVDKGDGHAQLAEASAIEVLVGSCALVRKFQPDAAVPLYYVSPVLLAVIAG